jgi:hypothetical protein
MWTKILNKGISITILKKLLSTSGASVYNRDEKIKNISNETASERSSNLTANVTALSSASMLRLKYFKPNTNRKKSTYRK